ncbi:MarR family transcriptional regulator, partial [Streptomyces daliensis]|nr:MarR family transcriptional regulator [Streptomyces daliensis]
MQRMSSRVFACLLASDEGALSSAQLAERLRVSPAAISGAVRYLSQVRMVSREREPGSRRERYRVHHDVWFEAITSRDTLLHRWTATLRTGVDAVGADSAAGRRIEESLEFLDFVAEEMNGLRERWLKQRAEREAEREAERSGPGGPG